MKMLFAYNLHELHQIIFILVSKCGFSGNFIESVSPFERDLYFGYYKQQLESEQKTAQEDEENTRSPVNISRGPVIGTRPNIGI